MSEKKGNPPNRPGTPDEDVVQFGDELPVLPIRNAVLFPGAVAPLVVGREKSVALVEDVDNFPAPVIAIFAQKDPGTDDTGAEDLPIRAAEAFAFGELPAVVRYGLRGSLELGWSPTSQFGVIA